MKVVHIETGRHLYGGALQVLYLLQGLQRYGIDNILVCAEESEISRRAAEFATIHPLPVAGDLDPRVWFHLGRLIRHERPDLIHVHSRRGADWWGGLAAKFHGMKAVLSRRVDNPETRLALRIKYPLFDRIITISQGITRVLLSQGIPATKVRCVPSAVSLEDYCRPCHQEWFLKEFELRPEHKTVAMVAQMISRKGHRYLLQAAVSILEKDADVRFLLFGQGPLHQQLRRLCHSAGITEAVRFAGFRRDLNRILPCVDLLVHPALREGLGLALLQAAAARRPIVAFATGGIPEIVRDGCNGYLIPLGDSRRLGEAILNILHDRQRAIRFGEAGRRLVHERFSINAMVEGNLRVYRELVHNMRC